MKKHSSLLFAALLFGLLLPFLTAAIPEIFPLRTVWPLPEAAPHYTYHGTLLNRVIALNARLNASQTVQEISRCAADCPSPLPFDPDGFLPIGNALTCESTEAFFLAPVSYTAEYGYLEMYFTGDGVRLTAIIDAETRLPLRIELSCPPDVLTSFMKERSLWDILRCYVSLLSLGEATDGDTQISSILHRQTAQIRGTSFKATATVIPSAGTMLFSLSGSVQQ